MGYMRHHAIVVTGFDMTTTLLACDKAENSNLAVIGPRESEVNGYGTFCVIPDGSQEGWDHSDEGNKNRDAFIQWLNDYRYEDGSTPIAWVEVQYGDDSGITEVVRHSDEILSSDDYRGATNAKD